MRTHRLVSLCCAMLAMATLDLRQPHLPRAASRLPRPRTFAASSSAPPSHSPTSSRGPRHSPGHLTRGALCYEFELATSRAFSENAIVWSNVRNGVKPGTGCAAVAASSAAPVTGDWLGCVRQWLRSTTGASGAKGATGATGAAGGIAGSTGDPAVSTTIQIAPCSRGLGRRGVAVVHRPAVRALRARPGDHAARDRRAGARRSSSTCAGRRADAAPEQPGLVRWKPASAARPAIRSGTRRSRRCSRPIRTSPTSASSTVSI